ncbi:MAG: TlpA family protein disulfide reductase, partial [Verrucomicrobia subdivision 3 bacterium]|nr:TlpA family protein disulfide reductase [Limisphaerales bacterium]
FRLPRLDGGELALEELRGRRLLLIFSDPHCGPCNALAPKLQEFNREHPEVALLMISRGEPKENRAKVKEHGLTFPVVLQQQWEISRKYAMFATPIAYLIDEAGIIAADVAVGTEAIQKLMSRSSAERDPQRNLASQHN